MPSEFVLNDTYQDVQKLIYQQIHQQKKRGGDFEELLSEANLSFMGAYHGYEDNRGAQFSTYVGFCLKMDFLTQARKLASRQAQIDRAKLILPNLPRYETATDVGEYGERTVDFVPASKPDAFDRDGFLDQLSEDAAMVATMALEPNKKVTKLAILQGGDEKPHCVKRAIIDFLKDLGWCAERIRESFEEIKSAIR